MGVAVEYYGKVVYIGGNAPDKSEAVEPVDDVLYLFGGDLQFFRDHSHREHLVPDACAEVADNAYGVVVCKGVEQPYHIGGITEVGVHSVFGYLQEAEVTQVLADARQC